jgi:hypothetical protein
MRFLCLTRSAFACVARSRTFLFEYAASHARVGMPELQKSDLLLLKTTEVFKKTVCAFFRNIP